jgi:hypothetical protein
MIVIQESLQMLIKRSFPEHDHLVQTLSPDGANEDRSGHVGLNTVNTDLLETKEADMKAIEQRLEIPIPPAQTYPPAAGDGHPVPAAVGASSPWPYGSREDGAFPDSQTAGHWDVF